MLIKKIASLVLVICLAVLPCACAKTPAYALDVAGAEISQEVYACFMDNVVLNPEKFGLSATPDEKAVKAKTEALCKEYVAVNTILNDLGAPLGDAEKAAVASAVIGLWNLFSTHYESLGITKQTLTKIETNKAAKDTLLLYYYDKDGSRAVGEDETRAYFNENYISFRSINGYLTKTDENGNTVKLTDEKAQALTSKLQSLAVQIADGKSFEDASKEFAENQGITAGSTGFKLLEKKSILTPKVSLSRSLNSPPANPALLLSTTTFSWLSNGKFRSVKRIISTAVRNASEHSEVPSSSK